MALLFDGKTFAKERETLLKEQIEQLTHQGKKLRVKTIVFLEDEGSILYTRLKKAAAERLGISYEPIEHHMTDPVEDLIDEIHSASHDKEITGVMIQKPTKAVYEAVCGADAPAFDVWWNNLTLAIDPDKDVDCLTRANLERIMTGDPYVLPATVKACISVLDEAKRVLQVSDQRWREKSAVVIGRSDIVGKPLAAILASQFAHVENVGKSDMPETLTKFDVIVSAVGKPNLVTGNMIQENAILLDVGAPKGDMERESVEPKVAFLTPVPGGIGPMTVVSLMENVVELGRN